MSGADIAPSWPPPEDEDWPGTWDLCLGAKGWRIESHTCENPVCWCWQDRDSPEKRCGWTAERARDELAGILRGHQPDEAHRIAALTGEQFLAEHGYGPDENGDAS